jgi:hypothetical protein
MLSVLALLAGGALAVWLHRRFSIAGDSPYGMAIAGAGGAAAGFLLLWLIQTGIGRALSMVGDLLVLLVIATTVIPVVVISILGARKAHDIRIRTKLRWERSHPQVSGLHAHNDE